MTIKPFAIQGADLTLGGVNLQAGATTIVIPGVTQAANYFVEEVSDTDDQTYSGFPPNTEITVIDKALYDTIVGQLDESGFADFITTTDDDGEIDEIEVGGSGTYTAANADRASLNDMYAYVGASSASDRPLVPEDWIQVPFRPKMRAGEVTNVGGGGNLEDIQVTRDDEEGETALSLADKDFNIRTTRTDPEQDADIGIYAADDLWLEAAGDDVVISAADEVRINSNNANSSNEWTFNASGHVVFPDGSVQVTAYIAGTGDNNIWIETFESDQPTTDFVQSAMSVEYDANGNIFALFNHSIPTPNSETYTSVAKLTPAGTVLWQVRFSVNLNTDGWGLAYDGVDTVYVAGRTSGTPLTYEFATLTKMDAVDGTIVWSKTYDFEANSSSAVVDVDSDLNPIMVGYAYNGTDNYIVTTKVDQADGSVLWSKTIDGQGYDEAYGMAVGPTGEVVTIGYVDQYDESTTYSVTPLTGSGVNVLVINRSDLTGAVFADTAEIAGTGITGTIGVNAINVYTGLTGTVREGSGAVFEITNVGDGTYYGSGIQNNGTTYLPGHKILVLGTDLGGATPANDCIVTVDSVTEGGLIFNWSVTGTAAGGSTTFNQLADYNNLSFNQFSGPSPVIIINVASGAFLAGIQAGTYGIGTRYSLPTGGVPLVLEVTSAYTDFGGGSYGVDVSIVSGSNPFVSGFESVTVTPSGAGATIYTPVTGTNYQTGSGVTFNFFSDSGSTYSALPVEITAVGSNYVLDDVVTISGALLGGTSPANDMTVTVNANLGSVVAFMSFSGNQQTATYRVRTEDNGIDFSGTGTWTLSNVESDQTDRMVVIKYATDGTIAWQKAIQFDAGYDCTGADADIDSLGNIYVCGQYQYDFNGDTTSAMSLVKFNSSGTKQWSRRVVGNCDTFGTSVVVGPDNNLYLSGVTGNNINSDYTWVVAKYDTDGLVVWQRLIDNTTTWTFGGTFWFGAAGGSNIAVGNGYVALAGTFGDPGTQPKATIVQIDTAATEFAVGDWDFKAATFSGVLNGTASDITVVDAGKTTGNAAPTAADFVTSSDSSNFLLATRAGAASGDSINNGAYSVSVGSNGVVTMATSRGSLEFGALPEVGGQSHFHIMKAAGDNADLFLGDDFNYVLQRGPAYIGSPAYGVEIGTYDNNGGAQHSWRFETNGSLTVPGSITRPVDDTLILVTSGTSGTSASVSVDGEFGRLILRTNNGVTTKDWTFGVDGVLTMPGGGSLNVSAPPTNSVGSSGDKAGMIAFDGTAIYYCITDFVEPYTATLIGGSITDYPSVLQGDYPKPLAGWTFVFNTVTYTLVADATSPNAGQWMLHVDQTISTDNVSIELTPPASNIWVKQAWSTTGSWS